MSFVELTEQEAEEYIKDLPKQQMEEMEEATPGIFRYMCEKYGPRYKFMHPSELLDAQKELLDEGYSHQMVRNMATTSLGIADDPDAVRSSALWISMAEDPSISLDIMRKQLRRQDLTYADKLKPNVIQSADAGNKAILELREGWAREYKAESKRYKKCLTSILKKLRDRNILPEHTVEAFTSLLAHNPEFLNTMHDALVHLYGILQGGILDLIGKDAISEDTWLRAIELTLALQQLTPEDIADPENEGFVTEVAEEHWSKVICLGLLIHNLQMFVTDESIRTLYESKYDPGKSDAERKEAEKQAQEMRLQLKNAKQTISEQKSQIAALNQRLSQTPTKNKDLSHLEHRHNVEIREKDAQIQELKQRIEQLEDEVSKQERRAMLAAEKTYKDKPWLDIELPKTGIVFLGGHPNLVKKIKERFPKWCYASTESDSPAFPSKAEAVYVWSGHLSHPLWHKMTAFYQGREKVLYVQATNIDRLVEEMKYEYWKLQEESRNGRVYEERKKADCSAVQPDPGQRPRQRELAGGQGCACGYAAGQPAGSQQDRKNH